MVKFGAQINSKIENSIINGFHFFCFGLENPFSRNWSGVLKVVINWYCSINLIVTSVKIPENTLALHSFLINNAE